MASLATTKSQLSQIYRFRKVFLSLILVGILWMIIVEYFQLRIPSIITRTDNGEARLHIIQFTGKKGHHNPSKDQKEYVFVESNRAIGIDIHKGFHHLIEILNSFRQYDGATCHAFKRGPSQDHAPKLKSCWFETRNWTMLTSGPNSSKYHRFGEQTRPWFWICNMVEFPFVIRQSVFNRIGLNQSYGEAMLLDFFLRSNGTLKIAVSRRCIFSKSQSIDQQSSGTKRQVYLDYGFLGHNHNILRIVRQDSIIWTKCSSNNSSCPDIPEQQNNVDHILLPYCCKTALNQILMHTVDALNHIGIDYRVCFGTLLGAIRSKTIIPWTQDADICLKSEQFTTQTFEKLKELLMPSNYSLAFLENMHRVVPVNAFVKYISNHSLVTKSDLFSEQALRFMKEMLPVPAPLWLRFPYADLYKYDKIFKNNATNVTIDGLEYCTGDKPHELLREWFGNKYMSTDENDRATSPQL